MEKRPDHITNLNLTALIEEVKRADQLSNEAREELEAAEELLKEARLKHRAAQEYQTTLRDFARALLDARDSDTQERVRSKYQKKLANFQDPASPFEGKTASRKEVESNINNLITLFEKVTADITTKLKRGEVDDVSKNAATAAAE